jgi:hypothetical protein
MKIAVEDNGWTPTSRVGVLAEQMSRGFATIVRDTNPVYSLRRSIKSASNRGMAIGSRPDRLGAIYQTTKKSLSSSWCTYIKTNTVSALEFTSLRSGSFGRVTKA